MKRIIIIAALIAGLYSCRTSNNEDKDFVYKINLDDAKIVVTHDISDFCDSVETIVLDTSDSVLLASVNKLIPTKNRILILDRNIRNRNGSTVAEFDMDGRFIRRYGNVGRGPGEYIGVSDFAVDEQRGRLYVLDHQIQRIITYDLNSGKYLEDRRIDIDGVRSYSIAGVGDLLFADANYLNFDSSNSMLRSWEKADFDIEKYYFPVGMHLKGWTNVTIIGGNNFLYNAGNNYCLFANENSNEIFKLTSDDVINYISVESENFIGEEERRIISESRKQKSGAVASGDYKHPIHFDRYWGIRNYFETDRYICFAILRGKALHTVLYDKNSKETQMAGWPNLDLIIKRDYPEVHSCLQFLQADTAGVFYCVPPEKLDLFRTAAREGMLVDGLDRLDELKRLPDESNIVVFYLEFEN